MTTAMSLYEKHAELLEKAVAALHTRDYFTPYPEHPKAYPAEDNDAGRIGLLLHESRVQRIGHRVLRIGLAKKYLHIFKLV